jgi:VCBS repeat-containing protein
MNAWRFLASAALLGGMLVLSACEADDAGNAEVTVTPASATVAKGGSVTLTASGWYDYKWSLSTPAIGNLSRTVGDTTVYTSLFAGPATQIVNVVAGTTSTSGTNGTAVSHTGQAIIVNL